MKSLEQLEEEFAKAAEQYAAAVEAREPPGGFVYFLPESNACKAAYSALLAARAEAKRQGEEEEIRKIVGDAYCDYRDAKYKGGPIRPCSDFILSSLKAAGFEVRRRHD